MAELESGHRLSHSRSNNTDDELQNKTKFNKRSSQKVARGRLKPLHVCMGCILLVIGVMPFANMITVRQFVHDHPILSFADNMVTEEEEEVMFGI
jgi:hypothetical protein